MRRENESLRYTGDEVSSEEEEGDGDEATAPAEKESSKERESWRPRKRIAALQAERRERK